MEADIEGRVSRKAFWELVKFSYPTHQLVFCTDVAINTLEFQGADKL